MDEQKITLSGRDYALMIAKATLRDQFAMAALTGIMANPVYNDEDSDDIAVIAYGMADHMLAAREQKK